MWNLNLRNREVLEENNSHYYIFHWDNVDLFPLKNETQRIVLWMKPNGYEVILQVLLISVTWRLEGTTLLVILI